MKPYNGHASVPVKSREKLPAGGYVAQIKDAVEDTQEWGSRLIIYFDIVEGDCRGFFQADYNDQTQEDKKWGGVYRLSIPKDDGSEKDEWSKKSFGKMTWSAEESNPGYHWDWNESGLVGKLIGVLFRNREWEFNGNTGWTTECCAVCAVDDIRKGKYKMPKDKTLASKNGGYAPFDSVPESDLPF